MIKTLAIYIYIWYYINRGGNEFKKKETNEKFFSSTRGMAVL